MWIVFNFRQRLVQCTVVFADTVYSEDRDTSIVVSAERICVYHTVKWVPEDRYTIVMWIVFNFRQRLVQCTVVFSDTVYSEDRDTSIVVSAERICVYHTVKWVPEDRYTIVMWIVFNFRQRLVQCTVVFSDTVYSEDRDTSIVVSAKRICVYHTLEERKSDLVSWNQKTIFSW